MTSCLALGLVMLMSSCGDDDNPTSPGPSATTTLAVWHTPISQVSVNLRGAPVVLAERAIAVGKSGAVLVQFDGTCISSDGDRIRLAASNTQDTGVNDGGTTAEAYSSDINRVSFSHSRAYPVTAGTHTFYAVGENLVETDGDGIASVYGCLTVKFFPDGANATVSHTGVQFVDQDVRGAAVEAAQLTINPAVAGKVLVRFDGYVFSTVGDRIVVAASNTQDWSANDGTSAVEALDADRNRRAFSHSRSYAVAPGSHTFYGVMENLIETAGTGVASVYASLTVEFFPSTGSVVFEHAGVSQSGIDVEGTPITMGQVTVDAPASGTAVVRYEGLCVSEAGDRIVLAASDSNSWSPGAGNSTVEAVSADLNYNGFSHTRAYRVTAGSHTFYGVCENYVETDGTGLASNYASLSVEFFPD
jgi:hypothetical protein